MSLQERVFEGTINRQVTLSYLLYLPPDYDTTDLWPLILFLHGDDARGSDPERGKVQGPPRRIVAGNELPFVICAPLCPVQSYWPELIYELNVLLDHLIEHYNIDSHCIYLTGLGIGAYGTWSLASRYPARFAAIAPVCGGGGWWMVERLVNTPTWAFHGDSDDVVPIIESKVMVNRIRAAGGIARFTVYSGSNIDAWTRAYDEADLYDWFLTHQRP